jgi:hypothetical protein
MLLPRADLSPVGMVTRPIKLNARFLWSSAVNRFRYECSRIDDAVRQIVQLKRRRDAADDMALRRALDYEISEKEKIVHLMSAHIEREMHRDNLGALRI